MFAPAANDWARVSTLKFGSSKPVVSTVRLGADQGARGVRGRQRRATTFGFVKPSEATTGLTPRLLAPPAPLALPPQPSQRELPTTQSGPATEGPVREITASGRLLAHQLAGSSQLLRDLTGAAPFKTTRSSSGS